MSHLKRSSWSLGAPSTFKHRGAESPTFTLCVRCERGVHLPRQALPVPSRSVPVTPRLSLTGRLGAAAPAAPGSLGSLRCFCAPFLLTHLLAVGLYFQGASLRFLV